MAYGIYGYPTTTQQPQQPKPQASDALMPVSAPTAVAQGAQPNQSNPMTGAAAPNPFAPSGASGASPWTLQPGAAPAGPAAAPGSFEALLNNATPARAANVQGAQKAISDMLMPSAGPSRESEAARSAFQKAQAEALRQGAENSALAGRVQTGQIVGDKQADLNRSLSQRADLENQLAISDGQRNDARQQAGISSLLSMEGLGSQERSQSAANALTARGQDITVRGQNIAQAEGAAERQSREAIAFAGLNLEEKRLAQEAQQFTSKQDFDKWALQKNLDNETAQRIWQSLENAKQIASTEKLGFANLSVREKELAQAGQQFKDELAFKKYATEGGWNQEEADRVWKSMEAEKERSFTASESALDRALNASQFAERIGLDKAQFAEQIRQFNSKEEFDRWATQKGFDQQDKELLWKSNEADVQRKWETGERLSTQEHQINLTRLQGDIQQANEQFTHLLNLDTMDKQAAIDKETAATANAYQVARDQAAMTHDQAMEQMKADLTGRLQQAGYDHETAMQAAELKAKAFQAELDRQQNANLAKAELAYKYKALSDQTGLSQQEIDVRKQEVSNSLNLGLQQLGLDEKKINATIQSQEFQDRMGVMSTFIEMAGDNPDAMDFAAKQFLNLLSDPTLPSGPMITPEQKAAGLAAMGSKSSPTSSDDIKAPQSGIKPVDTLSDSIVAPFDDLAKGNIIKSGTESVKKSALLPFRLVKGLF